MTYLDVVRVAWQRWPLFLLGIVISIVGAALYVAKATPTYESNAEVLVVKKRPEVVTGENVYASRRKEDHLSTHRVLIKSPVIVDRAIQDGNLSELETFANEKYTDPMVDLTTAVAERLSVELGSKDIGGNAENIMTLSFRGPVPEDCQVVIGAVLGSYQEFLDETFRNMGEDTMELISHARDDLQSDLRKQEEQYREFRRNSPLVSSGNSEVNPRQNRLSAIELQLSELLLRETNFESQLATLKHARESAQSTEELAALVSNLANREASRDAGRKLTGMDEELFALLQEEERIRQDFGPNHPHMQSVRKRIEATRNYFALPSSIHQPEAGAEKADSVNEGATAELYEQYVEQELASVRISKQLLNDLYDREHASAKKLTTFELQDEGFQRSISRTQELYDGVVSQLQAASLVKDYGGFDARVIAPAMAGLQVAPKAPIVFALAGLFGGLLGGALVMAAELCDRRFRTSDENQATAWLSDYWTRPSFDSRQSQGFARRCHGRNVTRVSSSSVDGDRIVSRRAYCVVLQQSWASQPCYSDHECGTWRR